MKSIVRFLQVQSQTGFQTIFLFIFDSLANVSDFAFHFWMGRVLIPADFAILQTLNSVVLVYTSASGVFQPVVGRFVAEARGREEDGTIIAIFQSFLRAAFWLGLALAILVFILANVIAQLLSLPAWTIQISAALIFLSTVRPIAIGVLQGQERFLSFGFTRFITAFGRLLLAGILIHYGFALQGAVIAFPLGWLAGVLSAFLFLGMAYWVKSKPVTKDFLREGWKLSLYALLGYLAFMSITSIDLVWVNHNLSGELAGAYASLVLLRRIIALLPGVAVVIMFPRIAKTLAEGHLPDRLLIETVAIVLVTSGILTLFYFVFGKEIIQFTFGKAYLAASPLLGWMGFAMIGVSLSSIWLNFYLAQKPRDFVMLLGISVVLEWFLLYMFPVSMSNAVLVFGITGWILTASGLLLYLFKTRPQLLIPQ